LYPAVACEDLPYGEPRLIANVHETPHVRDGILQDSFFGFIRVGVSSFEDDHTTAKPLHAVIHNERLLFPWIKRGACRQMVLFSEEIKLSQRLGLPYKYHWSEGCTAIFFKRGKILEQMMRTCFTEKANAKREGNSALSMAYKITANSAYGFWGIRVHDRDSCVVYEDRHDSKEYYRYLAEQKLIGVGKHRAANGINYLMLRVLKDLSVQDHNVAIASAITSLARCRLYSAVHDFEQKGETVLYTDTDSLITTLDLSKHPDLIEKYQWDHKGAELGTLKNELDDAFDKSADAQKQVDGELYFDRCWIAGAKFYCWERSKESTLDGKTYSSAKCKGYAKINGAEKLCTADFESLFESKPRMDELRTKLQNREIAYDEFVKESEPHLLSQEQLQFRIGRSDFLRETDKFTIRYVKVIKRFGINYLKGRVETTGQVRPMHID